MTTETIAERIETLSQEARHIQDQVRAIIKKSPLEFVEALHKIVSETMLSQPELTLSSPPKKRAESSRPLSSPPTKRKYPERITAGHRQRAIEGRRAVSKGDRPPLKDAIAIVIGKDQVTSLTIVERLAAKGWTPNSTNPRGYISVVLSSCKDAFECVTRGVYRVVPGFKPLKPRQRNHAGKPLGHPKTKIIGAIPVSVVNDAPTKSVPLTSLQRKVLNVLKDNRFTRSYDLARRMGKPVKTIQVALEGLQNQGFLFSRQRSNHREWAKSPLPPSDEVGSNFLTRNPFET
jgi:hypothetical protein